MSAVGEDSLRERVTATAEERRLSQNTLTAYRRGWLKLITWAAAEGLALDKLPQDRAGEFYEEVTRGRSASHHLQVKAALALLYDVLGAANPFAKCVAPKFSPEKIEPRYHTASQLGQLLRELRKDRRSYFGHLTYHLATALFFTGCRFHEWARLTIDRLIRQPGGMIIAARLQVKGSSFRGLPVTKDLSDSLRGMVRIPGKCQGRAASGWGSSLRDISFNLSRPRRHFLQQPGVQCSDQARLRASAGTCYFLPSSSAYGRDAVTERARSQPP